MHLPASPWLRALAGLSAALALACLYAAVSAPSASLLSAFVSAGGYGGGSGGEDDAGNEGEAELGARPFDDAEWGEGETGQGGVGGADLFALAAEAGREGEAGRGREAGGGKGEEDATLYPALDGSSPVVALLAAHRRRMQQRVEEARTQAERDEQRLQAAVRAAVRQLHVDRSALGDSFPLLDEAAASTIAALPPGDDSLAQIHAMLAAAPRVSVGEDVEGGDESGVGGEGTVGAAASTGVEGGVGQAAVGKAVEEAVGECMDLYFLAEGLQTRFHIGAWRGGRQGVPCTWSSTISFPLPFPLLLSPLAASPKPYTPISDTEAAAGGQGGGAVAGHAGAAEIAGRPRELLKLSFPPFSLSPSPHSLPPPTSLCVPSSYTEAAAGGQGGGAAAVHAGAAESTGRPARVVEALHSLPPPPPPPSSLAVSPSPFPNQRHRSSSRRTGRRSCGKKSKLSEFLFWYLPFHAWFDSEGPDHPKAVAHVEEQRAVLAAATSAATSAESTLKSTEVRMWEECGLRLPHSNWTEEQSALLERYAAVANVSGCTEQCTDWEAIYPEYETQPGLVAPKHVWQKLPEHYPDTHPNISLLLTYSGREERVQQLVSRLYACTHGMAGTGSLPGIRAEMLVSVMHPDVSLEAWMQARNDTAEGIFVVPVLPRLGAAPLMFNDLARMARGEVLMMLDGDALPPASCLWLDRLLTAFAAWPRLAVAGFRTDGLGGAGRAEEHVGGEEAPQAARAAAGVRFWKGLAEEMEGRGGAEGGEVGWRDPETGVAMHFTGLVTAFPLATRWVVKPTVFSCSPASPVLLATPLHLPHPAYPPTCSPSPPPAGGASTAAHGGRRPWGLAHRDTSTAPPLRRAISDGHPNAMLGAAIGAVDDPSLVLGGVTGETCSSEPPDGGGGAKLSPPHADSLRDASDGVAASTSSAAESDASIATRGLAGGSGGSVDARGARDEQAQTAEAGRAVADGKPAEGMVKGGGRSGNGEVAEEEAGSAGADGAAEGVGGAAADEGEATGRGDVEGSGKEERKGESSGKEQNAGGQGRNGEAEGKESKAEGVEGVARRQQGGGRGRLREMVRRAEQQRRVVGYLDVGREVARSVERHHRAQHATDALSGGGQGDKGQGGQGDREHGGAAGILPAQHGHAPHHAFTDSAPLHAPLHAHPHHPLHAPLSPLRAGGRLQQLQAEEWGGEGGMGRDVSTNSNMGAAEWLEGCLEEEEEWQQWRIDPQQLVIKSFIARGTYGSVHRGEPDSYTFPSTVEDHRGMLRVGSHVCCVVLEFLAGGTLKQLLMKHYHKKLSVHRVVHLALDIAEGLEYLHSRGIVHRDVKSDNMLLDKHQR
ncbi:unnamed protein product, partial [Closterium sp. NIES-54]